MLISLVFASLDYHVKRNMKIKFANREVVIVKIVFCGAPDTANILRLMDFVNEVRDGLTLTEKLCANHILSQQS